MSNSIVAAFTSKRMATVLAMGFASGIPLALTGGTLQAWMAAEKVDLTLIGIFSLVGLPYTIKYLWAPFMDRFVPPFLGRRRGWILTSQMLLVLSIIAMGLSHPSSHPGIVATIALFLAFFSASQDIAVDAYRTELLPKEEFGAGSAVYIMGYRIAMLTSGGLALILADHLPWRAVYFSMAALMGIMGLVTLFTPEPEHKVIPPRSIREAVVEPFIEFFKRSGALEILLFIIIYKLDVAMVSAMSTPFFLEMGFTKTQIGLVNKGFGLIATIVGTLTGGALMLRIGMLRSLWGFGIFQAVSTLSFLLIAQYSAQPSLLALTIALENFCSGMGTAAFSAFLMSLCNRRFTATQYALLSSFMALSRVFASAPTGYLAKAGGWHLYFIICTLAGIPGLVLLLRYSRWAKTAD